jgi:glycosyltransferase involved in cell wall biosynthesis
MPKVSICIPTYKQVEFLRKTLKSLLEQSFEDYEIIISDDSSDDAVKKLLDTFNFNGKLRYFRNSPALGSPVNWNFSLSQATGEYIKILHHDDFFTTAQSLDKFVKLLDNNPDAAFAFSGTEIELLALKIKKNHYCSESQFRKMIKNPDCLFFSNYIGAPSAVIFRNTRKLLFDTKLKWLVDVDWYIQWTMHSKIVYTKEALICTVHGGEGQITQSVISDKNIQIKEHVYLFQKLYNNVLDFKKYSVFFQLLFYKYKINDIAELRSVCDVSEKANAFFEEAIKLKSNFIFFKKVLYWVKKSSFTDYMFMLKTCFK